MIEGALHHLPGLGPETIRRFQSMGLTHWSDISSRPHDLPVKPASAAKLLAAIQQSQSMYEQQDWMGLTSQFHAKDQWRILSETFDDAAWFDIETDGCSSGSVITCICAYHKNQVHSFVRAENLDDFCDFIQSVDLLVSFNGASFDVPFVLREFGQPGLPCAHIDLRWVAYHAGLKGGLKKIESDLLIERPDDLIGVDGAEAVWLWEDWVICRKAAAREKLLRYCAADVVGLKAVGATLLRSLNPEFPSLMPPDFWSHITVPDIPIEAGHVSRDPVTPESRGLNPQYNHLRAVRQRQRW